MEVVSFSLSFSLSLSLSFKRNGMSEFTQVFCPLEREREKYGTREKEDTSRQGGV